MFHILVKQSNIIVKYLGKNFKFHQNLKISSQKIKKFHLHYHSVLEMWVFTNWYFSIIHCCFKICVVPKILNRSRNHFKSQVARHILKLSGSTFRFECLQITHAIATSRKIILSTNVSTSPRPPF